MILEKRHHRNATSQPSEVMNSFTLSLANGIQFPPTALRIKQRTQVSSSFPQVKKICRLWLTFGLKPQKTQSTYSSCPKVKQGTQDVTDLLAIGHCSHCIGLDANLPSPLCYILKGTSRSKRDFGKPVAYIFLSPVLISHKE